jgi:hypothetical protein
MSNKHSLTRAEIVRRRRAERVAKELEQTKKKALKPIVPVTSRTPTIPVSAMPRREEKNRRFNIALGLPEIHLRAPSFVMPHYRGNWRLVSAVLALLLGVVIYLVLTLPYFFVPVATVIGNERLSKEEINSVLGVGGHSIFTVKPEEVKTRLLLNYPELLSAKVDVYLPNHVYVTVTERQPVILWQQDGGYTWIDTTGVAFRPRGLVAGLVLINALDEPPAGITAVGDEISPPPYVKQELVDAIIALSPLVPDGSAMTFDSAQGLGWTDPRGWRVVFGVSAHDLPLKVRVYQSLVDSLMARRRIPEFISVAYPDAPFYRMAETDPDEELDELSVSSGQ